MHAARSAEMVQLLLNHNANPNLDDDHERRPLHWYAIRNDIAAMRAILQHGAEVDSVGPFYDPMLPIHKAAQRNLDTMELLVEHGADMGMRPSTEYVVAFGGVGGEDRCGEVFG
jgi:ankyrin repeat protein